MIATTIAALVMPWVTRPGRVDETAFPTKYGANHLIHEVDGEYGTTDFDHILAGRRITRLRTPPHSANWNADIERFFHSLKAECLDRLSFVGDRGLRNTVKHGYRPCQP